MAALSSRGASEQLLFYDEYMWLTRPFVVQLLCAINARQRPLAQRVT